MLTQRRTRDAATRDSAKYSLFLPEKWLGSAQQGGSAEQDYSSARSKSSYVSRRRTKRALPSATTTTAGRSDML